MQRRLLAESGLTLAKSLELALALETADKDTLTLKGANGTIVLTMSAQPAMHTMQAKGRGKHCGTNVNTWQVYVGSFKEVQCHSAARRVTFLRPAVVRNTLM